MKRAVLLHGTDGSPGSNWFPWLKQELVSRGYEVWVPDLPNNHTPNSKVYNDFLFGSKWDFTDNLVIGHSSGAVSVLNLLQDARCPHINTGVLVGAWARMDETDLDFEQFKDLFPDQAFDFSLIKSKADNLLYIHGDNDPLCPIEQARWLAEQTSSDIVVVPNGGHLSEGFGFTELPVAIEALAAHGWL